MLRRAFSAVGKAGGCRRSINTVANDQAFLPKIGKEPKVVDTAMDCVRGVLRSGCRVVIHGSVATPTELVDAMTEHGKEAGLRDVKICHMITSGEAPYARPEYKGIFDTTSFFVAENMREAVNDGRASYMPIFFSEVAHLFHRKILPVDVALVQVSPPDQHGFCSLGASLDIMVPAIQCATMVLGQINAKMPRTLGDGLIHISQFDRIYYKDGQIPQHSLKDPTREEKIIGRLIAENLVADGATIQLGIGDIPNTVLEGLEGHKDLGVHTEMFTDALLPLIQQGVINNAMKNKHKGKIVVNFTQGTQKLYDFIDDNPQVEFADLAYVNDPHIISLQPKMTAINTCIEIDLTGQVCSDSIGTRIYSGVGGQVDFLRGASLNPEGKAILAMPSRTRKGEARIVEFLKEGAGVVSPRAQVHYVVTEHGIACLFGKTLPERAKALIRIAHPDDQEKLEKAAYKRFRKQWTDPGVLRF